MRSNAQRLIRVEGRRIGHPMRPSLTVWRLSIEPGGPPQESCGTCASHNALYALGELGIGLGLAWVVSYRNRAAVDFRLVLLGSILPDVIDKPLGAILHLEARLWAHSLVFLAAILLLGLLPALRGMRWVVFGDAVHLLFDLIWQQPLVMLLPLFVLAFPAETTPQTCAAYFEILLMDPYVQFGEIVGSVILIAIAWRYGLFSWTALKKFAKDGRLVRPAEPTGTAATP